MLIQELSPLSSIRQLDPLGVERRTDIRRLRVFIVDTVPDIHYDPKSSWEIDIPGCRGSSGDGKFNPGISTDPQEKSSDIQPIGSVGPIGRVNVYPVRS